MDAHVFLEQVIRVSRELNDARDELTQLNQKLIYSSPRFDNEVSQTSQNNDKVPKLLSRQEVLINRIVELTAELDRVKSEVLKVVERIEDDEISEVMVMRYVMLKSVTNIAIYLDRSDKWVYDAQKRGQEMVYTILKRKRYTRRTYLLYDFHKNMVIMNNTAKEICKFLEITVQLFNAHYHQELTIETYIICDSLDDLDKYEKQLKGR